MTDEQRFKKFSYKEFDITLDRIGCGIFICHKKISHKVMPNGVKIWKGNPNKNETIYQFYIRIKDVVKYLRQYPR